MGLKVRWNEKAAEFYIYKNHKKERKAYPAGTNKKKAEKQAEEMRADLRRTNAGLSVTPTGAPTLAAYMDTWLEDITTRCKTTTRNSYRQEIDNHINPILGTRRVNTLTKKDCIELVQHWAATGLRTQSLRLMLSVLRAALTGATGTHLPANPAFGLNRECRQPDEVKHEWRPYTLEESETFLAHARGLEPRAYTMFLIGFRAGLRIGETLALQWGDVDFAGHRLAVQRSRNQEGIVTSPKRGRRYVDLGDELATHLRTLPKVDPAALVCTTAGGDAYEQRTVSNLFHRVIRSAKMRHIRVHDMRHTFASQLLERGVPLHYVKEQLGHSSIKITADLYAHLVPGANREWVNRLTPAYPVAPALQ